MSEAKDVKIDVAEVNIEYLKKLLAGLLVKTEKPVARTKIEGVVDWLDNLKFIDVYATALHNIIGEIGITDSELTLYGERLKAILGKVHIYSQLYIRDVKAQNLLGLEGIKTDLTEVGLETIELLSDVEYVYRRCDNTVTKCILPKTVDTLVKERGVTKTAAEKLSREDEGYQLALGLLLKIGSIRHAVMLTHKEIGDLHSDVRQSVSVFRDIEPKR